MSSQELIAANEFCTRHQLDITFIYTLEEYGLVEITTIETTAFIHASQLPRLEQVLRLHDELGINLEGIGAITHLLEQMDAMQVEINELKNRVRFYEVIQS